MKERELGPLLHSLQVQTWTRPSLGSHGQDESAPTPHVCSGLCTSRLLEKNVFCGFGHLVGLDL